MGVLKPHTHQGSVPRLGLPLRSTAVHSLAAEDARCNDCNGCGGWGSQRQTMVVIVDGAARVVDGNSRGHQATVGCVAGIDTAGT